MTLQRWTEHNLAGFVVTVIVRSDLNLFPVGKGGVCVGGQLCSPFQP